MSDDFHDGFIVEENVWRLLQVQLTFLDSELQLESVEYDYEEVFYDDYNVQDKVSTQSQLTSTKSPENEIREV